MNLIGYLLSDNRGRQRTVTLDYLLSFNDDDDEHPDAEIRALADRAYVAVRMLVDAVDAYDAQATSEALKPARPSSDEPLQHSVEES